MLLKRLMVDFREQQKKSVMVVSTDVYRPAAIEQLKTLASEVGANFFPSQTSQDPVDIATHSVYSKYDKNSYTIINNKKTTEQGTEEQNYEAILGDNNVLVYNDQDSISIEPNTHSLISLLIKLMNSSVDSIDTKWFDLENEGILYKARFLWNDTTTISVENNDILCNHYRLDLKIVIDDSKIFEKTDYFNDLFFDINSIRQIWVEKWQKKQRIIKISIKNSLVNLTIAIQN